MAEGNSYSNILLEENGTSEPPSSVEGAGELSLPSQQEGDDSKGNIYVLHVHYSYIVCLGEVL